MLQTEKSEIVECHRSKLKDLEVLRRLKERDDFLDRLCVSQGFDRPLCCPNPVSVSLFLCANLSQTNKRKRKREKEKEKERET